MLDLSGEQGKPTAQPITELPVLLKCRTDHKAGACYLEPLAAFLLTVSAALLLPAQILEDGHLHRHARGWLRVCFCGPAPSSHLQADRGPVTRGRTQGQLRELILEWVHPAAGSLFQRCAHQRTFWNKRHRSSLYSGP